MIAETLVVRLCAACIRHARTRALGLQRQSKLHALSSIHGSSGAQVVLPLQGHRRLFGSTSVTLQTKPEDEFDVTKNPFFDKYRDKLKHLQQADPEGFENRVTNLLEKKKAPVQPPPGDQSAEPINKPEIPGSSGPRSWPPKSLDEIMKVDLLKDLDANTIDQIWKEHHISKDCVFSVIPDVEYDEVYAKSKLSPNFLFTLPKGDGFEFYLCQFSGKDVYFTSLGMYQLVKENAPPCLTVAHFPELKAEKGIVLMAGEYDRKVISKAEALNLVKQMAMYYGRNAAHRHSLVRLFNSAPDKFQYMDIIEEYKRNKDHLEENPY